MQNTVYMQDLENKINKYDTEVKNMKFRYKSLFNDIREVDVAIAQKGIMIRESDIQGVAREQLCSTT